MDELKKCPFCGREAEVIKQYKSSNPGNFEEMHYQIKCTYCSAQSGWADDKQFIIDWWNGKYNSAHESDVKLIEQLEKVLRIANNPYLSTSGGDNRTAREAINAKTVAVNEAMAAIAAWRGEK